jgi:hypothetical protein
VKYFFNKFIRQKQKLHFLHLLQGGPSPGGLGM